MCKFITAITQHNAIVLRLGIFRLGLSLQYFGPALLSDGQKDIRFPRHKETQVSRVTPRERREG